MTKYTLEIETSVGIGRIPSDVLAEHIGYALRGLVDPAKKRPHSRTTVKVLSVVEPRQHPFDGPEVFDDDTTVTTMLTEPIRGGATLVPEHQEGLNEVFRAIGEDFPHLRDLFRAKGAPRDVGEGDWQLPTDDRVGDDL